MRMMLRRLHSPISFRCSEATRQTRRALPKTTSGGSLSGSRSWSDVASDVVQAAPPAGRVGMASSAVRATSPKPWLMTTGVEGGLRHGAPSAGEQLTQDIAPATVGYRPILRIPQIGLRYRPGGVAKGGCISDKVVIETTFSLPL